MFFEPKLWRLEGDEFAEYFEEAVARARSIVWTSKGLTPLDVSPHTQSLTQSSPLDVNPHTQSPPPDVSSPPQSLTQSSPLDVIVDLSLKQSLPPSVLSVEVNPATSIQSAPSITELSHPQAVTHSVTRSSSDAVTHSPSPHTEASLSSHSTVTNSVTVPSRTSTTKHAIVLSEEEFEAPDPHRVKHLLRDASVIIGMHPDQVFCNF